MSPPANTPPRDPLAALEAAAGLLVARRASPVPPYPAVAREVERALASQRYGADDVARLVGADAVLAAGVLRIANAALYRRGEPVTTLSRAIARVGTRQVFRLLVATGLAEAARAPGPLLALRRACWTAGLATAHVAEALAARRGVGEEEAFLAGLLADFGSVVAAGAFEAALRAPAAPAGPFPRPAWAGALERLRGPAGRAAVRSWGLPGVFEAVLGGDAASAPALVPLVATARAAAGHLAGVPHVGAGALAAVAGLAAVERPLVAGVLVGVPELVVAFEPPGSEPAGTEQASAPAEPPGPWWPAPADVALALSAGSCQARIVEATGADRALPAFLAVASPIPLAEETLAALLVPAAGPGAPAVEGWGTVVSCRPEGAGHRVVLRGTALDDRAWSAWRTRFGAG